jgi:hypothetical protein
MTVIETISQPPRRRGRPAGSKTRPDAPSKLKSAPAVPGATPTDQDIFGAVKLPPENPAPGAASELPPENPAPGAASELPPENPAPKTETDTADEHRPLASNIFDSVTMMLATFFGNFWHPRPIGKNAAAGEIPVDEKEIVVLALCRYFKSVGMAILSPLQDLMMAIFFYCSPRLMMMLQAYRQKRAARAKTNPPPDPRVTRPANSPKPPKPAETATVPETSKNSLDEMHSEAKADQAK